MGAIIGDHERPSNCCPSESILDLCFHGKYPSKILSLPSLSFPFEQSSVGGRGNLIVASMCERPQGFGEMQITTQIGEAPNGFPLRSRSNKHGKKKGSLNERHTAVDLFGTVAPKTR